MFPRERIILRSSTFSPVAARRHTLCAGMLVLVLSCVLAVSSLATTAVVPDDTPTVQAALDIGADTVLVRSENYLETPQIDRSVVLRSESLDGMNASAPVLAGLLLRFDRAGSVRVEGFRIRGPVMFRSMASETRFVRCRLDSTTSMESDSFDGWLTVTGCVFGGSVKLYARGVTADANHVQGVLSVASGWSQARWNVVHGSNSGLSVESYSNVTRPAVGNTVRGGTGLEVACDGEFEVSGNLIEDCSGAGIRILDASDRVRIRDNIVRRCGAGIVSRSHAPEASGNTIESCDGNGIDLQSVAGTIQVAGNRVIRCGGNGLFLSAGGDLVEAFGNVIGRNGGDGIHVGYSEPAHVHHNTIFLNGRHGVFIEHAASLLTIDHNLVSGNHDAGLAVGVTEHSPDLSCNDWFGNGSNDGSPDDLSVDPLFCDLPADDVHLRSDSPLLNAGDCGSIGALGAGCDSPTSMLVLRFAVGRVAGGGLVEWRLGTTTLFSPVALERAESRDGPWLTIQSNLRSIGSVLDEDVRPERSYWYRLVDHGHRTLAEPIELHDTDRLTFSLEAFSANPVVTRTSIHFIVGASSHVVLDLLDLQGRRLESLAEGFHVPGRYTIDWDPSHVRPGVYMVRLRSTEGLLIRRMTVLR